MIPNVFPYLRSCYPNSTVFDLIQNCISVMLSKFDLQQKDFVEGNLDILNFLIVGLLPEVQKL